MNIPTGYRIDLYTANVIEVSEDTLRKPGGYLNREQIEQLNQLIDDRSRPLVNHLPASGQQDKDWITRAFAIQRQVKTRAVELLIENDLVSVRPRFIETLLSFVNDEKEEN